MSTCFYYPCQEGKPKFRKRKLLKKQPRRKLLHNAILQKYGNTLYRTRKQKIKSSTLESTIEENTLLEKILQLQRLLTVSNNSKPTKNNNAACKKSTTNKRKGNNQALRNRREAVPQYPQFPENDEADIEIATGYSFEGDFEEGTELNQEEMPIKTSPKQSEPVTSIKRKSGTASTIKVPDRPNGAYCMCHKRECPRCKVVCPCNEHMCPECGFFTRMVVTMRAVQGLKDIVQAQKARKKNQNGAVYERQACKEYLFTNCESNAIKPCKTECNHSAMVRVGGGYVPLIEYLKSHNKVILSKFDRDFGPSYLVPWTPYYPGPLKKGKPRGIRYVDSITQQLEELIYANKVAGCAEKCKQTVGE